MEDRFEKKKKVIQKESQQKNGMYEGEFRRLEQ